MSRPLNRPTPRLPVEAMQTHHILAPLSSHWRKATCEEVDCAHYLHGWMLPLSGLDEGDIWQAEQSGRRFRRVEAPDGDTYLEFEAGQPCFRSSTHQVRVDKPELFIVRNGDWRGTDNERPIRFSGADAWADHMQTGLDKFRE